MCGRYSLVTTTQQIAQQLDIVLDDEQPIPPNYNVAPTHPGLVILNEAPEQLQYLRWGLVPYWSKDTESGPKLINARREGIESKPSFRIPIRQRRCLVIADSFYEWRAEGKAKIPYRILRPNGELLIMAGIWDVWRNEDQYMRTFSIITTDANAEIAALHNRMPVLLQQKEQQTDWLADSSLEQVLDLLQTPADGTLRYYRVSQALNSVRNNGPQLHEEETDASLKLF
ncbi:MAG: SOS response-associated peptidase [Bacteroidetes bacterium]|nr:MAG: SOS response-associated peptidase [Bacteroidota bacterium]PTM14952.1 MAG: SOS response-associated peptidase [Bacteroidota bacterium]